MVGVARGYFHSMMLCWWGLISIVERVALISQGMPRCMAFMQARVLGHWAEKGRRFWQLV